MIQDLPAGHAHLELPAFDRQRIDAVDLERFRPYVTDIYTEYFWLEPGAEHCKLLAYLSTCWSSATLIDLGTDQGSSALALSYNPSNRVISYVIEDRRLNPINLPNIEFRVKDALEDREEILTAPLIMLDTAHDGVFERRVYDMLDAAGYEGLLLLDDVHLNAAMQDFWSRISLEKFDLTPLGHCSGTGLVRFAPLEPGHAVRHRLERTTGVGENDRTTAGSSGSVAVVSL